MKNTKIINIYGCSWSHGVPNIDSGKSWPYYFSLLLPKKYIINNFAILGSSLDYSIFQLQKNKNIADINIFQITKPIRYTFWDYNYFNSSNMKHVTKRYKEFDKKLSENLLTTMGLGNLKNINKKNRKWFHTYVDMGFIEGKTIEAVNCSHLYYALNNSDYCFSHTNNPMYSQYNFDSIENILNFETYSRDIGHHFDEEGNKLVAEFVYSKIKDRLEQE